MKDKLKILVVDDNVTDRQIISNIVTQLSNVELIGTASNGKIALAKIEFGNPDLVLLDLVMPEMDGLETLSHIKKDHPGTDVIIISGVDIKTAGITLQALESGALDFIPKPGTSPAVESVSELKATIARLIPIAQTRKYSRRIRNISNDKKRGLVSVSVKKETPRKPAWPGSLKETVSPRNCKKLKLEILAIGVSTGGPNALQKIIPKLETGFPVPILVVQHMPPMFTASLASRLDSESNIKVVEAVEGMIVEKGIMYIAPGGRHMVVRKNGARKIIGLLDSPPVNSCRPAVDVLLRSVGMAYGGNALTLILTGMGNDGASGVATIRRKGGYSLVQDEKSSVVWGMPGSVVEIGQADEIISLDKMADRITRLIKGG